MVAASAAGASPRRGSPPSNRTPRAAFATPRYGGSNDSTRELPGLATASLTWRSNLKSLNQGSLQLDWTFPVDRDQPEGLRWYVQLFSGYGETLLDYNHRQTSLGLGLTLFQF